MYGTASAGEGTKSFTGGLIVNKKIGTNFKFNNMDDSGGLGVATLCSGVFLGMARNQGKKEDLLDFYQHDFQENQNQNIFFGNPKGFGVP